MIHWEIDNRDFAILVQVAERALRELKDYPDDKHSLVMDLHACHSNGCPLDFEGMLKASDRDLAHDIYGIRKAIDRDTGKLTEDLFVPRYTALRTELPGGVVFSGGTEEEHSILRKRGNFVAEYCRSKGWSPDSLTIEQTLEVRSQPGWKNPDGVSQKPICGILL